jgi:hypothetical protein
LTGTHGQEEKSLYGGKLHRGFTVIGQGRERDSTTWLWTTSTLILRRQVRRWNEYHQWLSELSVAKTQERNAVLRIDDEEKRATSERPQILGVQATQWEKQNSTKDLSNEKAATRRVH